jgi:hypothetical protein
MSRVRPPARPREPRRPRKDIRLLEINMAAQWAYLAASREDLHRALRDLKGLTDDDSACKRIAVKDALWKRFDEEA